MSRNIGPQGLALVKSFESYVGYVYDDLLPPLKGKYREWDGGTVQGTLTIGYGHTDAAAHPLKCKLGAKVTEAQASEILDVDLNECEAAVSTLVKVQLSQHQFDALVSFVFNVGSGAFKGSTLLRKLNLGDYGAVPAELMKWVNSKGKKLPGLERRRRAEAALWRDLDETSPPVKTPSVVEVIEKPLTQSRTLAGAGTAGIGGSALLTESATSIADAMVQADGHISAGSVFGLVVGVTIVAGALVAIYAKWDERGRPLPMWLSRHPAPIPAEPAT